MKTVRYLLFICFFFIGCNENRDEKNPFLYEALIRESLDYMNMPRPADSYNYPVYPGMKEWEDLTTSQAMVEACQIPQNTLHEMSTQAVIQAIWEYPFLSEVFHRFAYQTDFEAIFLKNNAYMELIEREDAGTALFERLVLVNPLTPAPKFESQALEILISQTAFLSQLNDDTKRKIVETAFKNDDLRQSYFNGDKSSFTYYISAAVTCLLVGMTMVAADYLPFVEAVNNNDELKFFIIGKIPKEAWDDSDSAYIYMESVYGDIPQMIISYGKKYLNIN